MRTLALIMFLSTSASPALAQDGQFNGHRGQRAERSEADRSSRAERAEARSQAMESRREARQQQRTTSVERQAVSTASTGSSDQAQSASDGQTENRRFQRQGRDGTRGARGYVPRQREVRTIPDTSTTPAVTQQQTRDGVTTQHRSGERHSSANHRRWNRDGWRNDSRYDWRRWRNHHRSTFRLGLYLDPFGWNYRRWGIGSMLYPSYYSSSFWISDPWQYRLPPAYAPYRWVRYHNDALLIDTWSGEVVDVIYNFFW